MKFEEHMVLDSGSGLQSEKRKSPIDSEYEGSKHLVVNLLPLHPYQYPDHQSIRKALSGGGINPIIKHYSLSAVTVIINRKLKAEYGQLLKGDRCDVRFVEPDYPLIMKRILPVRPTDVFVDWFQFLTLALGAVGEAPKYVPVSVTVFSNAGKPERTRVAASMPTTVSILLREAGIQLGDHIVTDNPYSGKVIDTEAAIDQLRPVELLVFPKDQRNSKSFALRFIGKFGTASRRFDGMFDTGDAYRNRVCQKCLGCTAICPVKLQPFLLSAIAERGSFKDAMELDLAACIECGLCSCACPSGIPLMKNIQMLKKEL